MKKAKIFILLCFFSPLGIGFGQNSTINSTSNELTPARGHYKILATLSPKPISGHEALDKLLFPFDQEHAAKVLKEKPFYLQNITVGDFKIPDPPANSSLQTRAELNYLLALQHNRSMEDIRASLYMSSIFLTPSDVGQLIGYWINPVKLPLTDSLLSNVAEDANYFLWSLKFKYARVRPYVLEPKIHDLEESFAASYPSGHVTYAYIYAYIYQELAPEFSDYFIKDAYAMAHAREIIGVHYPSDSEASRIFARQLINMLLQNVKFKRDFTRVKNEWDSKRAETLLLMYEVNSK